MEGHRGQVSLLQLVLVLVLGAMITFAMLPSLNSNGKQQVAVVTQATELANTKMQEAVGNVKKIPNPGGQPQP